jgi:DNA repair protein RadC
MIRSTAIPALPAHERPRERLVTLGAAALTDAELVAIQLGTGGRGESAIALRLRSAERELGLRLLDHVIVAGDTWRSITAAR